MSALHINPCAATRVSTSAPHGMLWPRAKTAASLLRARDFIISVSRGRVAMAA
jgi:hypothetical protein